MKRVLVLGGNGMLGHQMVRRLRTGWSVVATARKPGEGVDAVGDVTDAAFLSRLLDETRPDVLINCTGVIKQRIHAVPLADVCRVNVMLPHQLGLWAAEHGAKLIHFSTDCVFTGSRSGPAYTELESPDVSDAYGYSKAAGEVRFLQAALTLRTSIVGPERENGLGLLAWFLSQPDGVQVRGFTNHWWSGVTTLELSTIVAELLARDVPLSGLYQVASEPVTKLELLELFAAVYRRRVTITPFEAPGAVYRVLDGSKFNREFGRKTPSLRTQVEELCSQTSVY